MFGSLFPLLFTCTAIAGVLPSGRADTDRDISGNPPQGISNDTLFDAFDKRGIFGPIATDSAAGVAGGLITSGSPPLSSFFAGLQPPVSEFPLLIATYTLHTKRGYTIVPNQHVVGSLRGSSWNRHRRWALPI